LQQPAQQDAIIVDGDPQVYRLRAVVRHSGSGLSSGHYIADVLVGDSWFRFNDETVERIQRSARSSRRASSLDVAPDGPCAYILFYERQVLPS
jgi:ubiquitin C-terminal hydrolase